jgi:hypothetical protein
MDAAGPIICAGLTPTAGALRGAFQKALHTRDPRVQTPGPAKEVGVLRA